MAARIRNSEWEDDIELINDLKENVSRNLRQSEIVDLMKVKYPMYSWSLRTLSRRLHHFGIRYTDRLCRYRRGERGRQERNERTRKVIRLPLTTQEGSRSSWTQRPKKPGVRHYGGRKSGRS